MFDILPINSTVGISWSIGSIVAGHMYEQQGDKVVLARRYLVEQMNMAQGQVEAISKNDLMPFFERAVGVDAWQARELLWGTYEPYSMWLVFALIGLVSMLAVVVYNHVVKAADSNPGHSLNTRGGTWVRVFLIPICLLLLAATIHAPSTGFGLNAALFWTMLIVSFFPGASKDENPPVP